MIVLTSLEKDATITAKNTPNVYLLLLDEYSATQSLKEEWGFDNSGIDSALRSRNFSVNATSRSNYQMTFFSMASMLNMDYLHPGFEQKYIRVPDYPGCQQWLANPRVVRLFKQAGYSFENLSIFDIDNQPKPDLHDLLVNGRDLLTVNNLYHVAMRDYVPYIRNRSAIKRDPEFHDPAVYYMDTYNKQRADQLMQLAGRASKPKFIYAHFLMPHFPFFYDSAGRYLPVSIAKSTIENKDPLLYRDNVRHANDKLLKMVDAILAKEQGNAVILVMGDHGFRPQQPAKNKEELFRNYSAIYFPDHNYESFPDSMTNVNTFRIVFNKLFGAGYPLLPNHCKELQGESR